MINMKESIIVKEFIHFSRDDFCQQISFITYALDVFFTIKFKSKGVQYFCIIVVNWRRKKKHKKIFFIRFLNLWF